MILLDTHAVIWMTNDDPAMGPQSQLLAREALDSNQLAFSAIVFWELALLTTKGRLRIRQSPADLRRELLATGIIELPLSGDIAILAVNLDNLHGDPADRFIAATAVAHSATLMTADQALLTWPNTLPRQNASR